MPIDRRKTERIIDGGPVYLPSYSFESLNITLLDTIQSVLASCTLVSQQLAATEARVGDAFVSGRGYSLGTVRHRINSLANQLTMTSVLCERIFEQQSAMILL